MTNTILYSYLTGWIITSIGLALTTRGQSRQASVIVAAGAFWPFLVVGAAQFAAVALVAEVVRVRGQHQKSVIDDLDELLDAWLDGAGSDGQSNDRAIGGAVAGDGRLSAVTGRDNAHESSVSVHRQTVGRL